MGIGMDILWAVALIVSSYAVGHKHGVTKGKEYGCIIGYQQRLEDDSQDQALNELAEQAQKLDMGY